MSKQRERFGTFGLRKSERIAKPTVLNFLEHKIQLAISDIDHLKSSRATLQRSLLTERLSCDEYQKEVSALDGQYKHIACGVEYSHQATQGSRGR